jgi:hypothetical protein
VRVVFIVGFYCINLVINTGEIHLFTFILHSEIIIRPELTKLLMNYTIWPKF